MAELHCEKTSHGWVDEPTARPIAHPLGPLLRYGRSADPWRSRLTALAVLLVLLTPLAVAWSLAPSPSGVGTHQQLGQPACAMLVLTGYPCPTCGMTTAFAHTVRGQWLAGFHAQPMGWFLAVAAMVAASLAGYSVVVPGRWQVNWFQIQPHRVMIGVLVLFLAAWGYKIVTIGMSTGP